MRKSLLQTVKDMSIRAGDIQRHPSPQNQRTSPLQRFSRKVGKFDLSKVLNPIHVVPDGDGGYYAVEGATRVEACIEDPKYGPDTMLPCRVYGNGQSISDADLSELFLVLNTDVIAVSAGVSFRIAVNAGRPAAVFAQSQIERLGPKFRTTSGVWTATLNYGEQAVERAVDWILDLWGEEYGVPSQIFSAIVHILSQDGGEEELAKRRKIIAKDEPSNWVLRARTDQFKVIGQREMLQTYIVKRLLGRSR